MQVFVEMDEGNVQSTHRFFKSHFAINDEVLYVDSKQKGLKPKVRGYIFEVSKQRLNDLILTKGVKSVNVIKKFGV